MIKVENYIDVRKRLVELDCPQPAGVVVLPQNFAHASEKSDLRYTLEGVTLTKFLKQEGLEVGIVAGAEHSSDPEIYMSLMVVLPTIVLTATHVIQNPDSMTLVLTLIESFCRTHFARAQKVANVKFAIVEERTPDSSCRKISYEGPVNGIKEMRPYVGLDATTD